MTRIISENDRYLNKKYISTIDGKTRQYIEISYYYENHSEGYKKGFYISFLNEEGIPENINFKTADSILNSWDLKRLNY